MEALQGAALNPARDLGPRLAHFLLPIPGKGSSDFGYAWIPMTAPLLGGITATFGLFSYLRKSHRCKIICDHAPKYSCFIFNQSQLKN